MSKVSAELHAAVYVVCRCKWESATIQEGDSDRLVAHLGVEGHFDRLLFDSTLVDVDGAKAICMAHDWNTRAILNTLDEAVATPWDHQVNVPVLSQQ